MAVSTIGVADATSPDKYLHTHSRTISSTAREDQYVQQGESAYPTYNAIAANIAIATDDSHILQIMGDGTNYCRIKRITVEIEGIAGAATGNQFGLYRLTSAGTGGSPVTPAPYDTADTYGGSAMTLPSSKGTESTLLWRPGRMAIPGNWNEVPYHRMVWEARPDMKPIIFGTATSNGIAFKNLEPETNADVTVNIEFIVTSYL